MRRFPLSVLTAALVALGPTVHAGPASPKPFQVRQPDGTTFLARMRGDEFQNWVETVDGFTILQNAKTACWEFAVRDRATGELQPSGHAVHPEVAAPAYMERHLTPARREAAASSRQSARAPRRAERVAGPSTSKVLVIRVGFSDRALVTPASGWDDRIFKTGAGVKSVRQFFRDNSRGLLDVLPVPHTQPGTPQGVVDVTLATTAHPNNPGREDYSVETAWLNAALAQAAPYVNFASLDTNHDGIIQPTEASIYFIPAGYEYSGTRKTPAVWAHAWGGPGVTAGGKAIEDWAMNGELNDADRLHPMGVIAHELGHSLLGLPDLYDTSYGNRGLGVFSLMSFGSWGADTGEDMGSTPVSLDAWSRILLGWTTPLAPPQDGQVLSLGLPFSGPSAALQFKNPSLSAKEYWLVENRHPSGWDRGLTDSLGASWQGGLLTIHVDDAIPGNWSGAGSHQKVMAEHADNAAYGTAGTDASFFRAAGNPAFTPKTTPGATYYDGRASGLGFTTASAPGTTMTLKTYATATARVTPTAYTAVFGEAVPFSALVSNHTSDNRVNWTVSTGGGVFSLPQTPGNGTLTTLTTGGTAGSYTVTATPVEAEGIAGSAPLSLVPPTAVVMGLRASAKTITQNDPVTLTATISGITNQQVAWRKSGGSFGRVSSTEADWSSSTLGTYTVTVSSLVAPAREASTTLTVVAPPEIPLISAPTYATTGTSGLLATVPTQTRSTFEWTVSGGTITAGQDTTSVTFTAGDPGSLVLGCSAVNAAGSASPRGFQTVTVLPVPTTPVISAPASVVATLTGPTASVQPQPHGKTYAWTITGGTITGGQGTPSITFTATAPGSVTLGCTATNLAGTPSPVGSVTLLATDPAEVTVDRPTASVASGSSLSLVGSTPVGTIAWSVPAGQGTLEAATTASGVPNRYTAPAGLMSDLTTTLTLTNSTNPAKRATSVITVKTLNVNGDAVLDLRDILALAQDWGSTAARSRLAGGPTVSEADLALLLAGLGL